MSKTIITLYNRHAKKFWTCDKCNCKIAKDDLYRDQETKTYDNCREHVTIKHRRICKYCAGLEEVPKTYEFTDREPVAFNCIKYWLIGVGYDENRELKLIVQSWETGKYYFKDIVYDYQCNRLTVKNVRFV